MFIVLAVFGVSRVFWLLLSFRDCDIQGVRGVWSVWGILVCGDSVMFRVLGVLGVFGVSRIFWLFLSFRVSVMFRVFGVFGVFWLVGTV